MAGAAASAATKPRRLSVVIAGAGSVASRERRAWSAGSEAERASASPHAPAHHAAHAAALPALHHRHHATARASARRALALLRARGRHGIARLSGAAHHAAHPAAGWRAGGRARGTWGAAAHLSRRRSGPGEGKDGCRQSESVAHVRSGFGGRTGTVYPTLTDLNLASAAHTSSAPGVQRG
jgi:hypothetical protein